MVKNMSVKNCFFLIILSGFILYTPFTVFAQHSGLTPEQTGRSQLLTLQNAHIRLTVQTQKDKLVSETIKAVEKHSAFFNGASPVMKSDGNFALDVMWTDWQAPGMKNNAENSVLLSKKDFHLTHYKNTEAAGVKTLVLDLSGNDIPIIVSVTYRLAPGDFFIKKQISVRDTLFGYHFLRRIYPLSVTLQGKFRVLKSGGIRSAGCLRGRSWRMFFRLRISSFTESDRTKC